jgi:von Willebrand factor type A domain.
VRGAGGDVPIIVAPPTGGAGGSSSSSTVEIVPASVDVNCGTQTQDPTPQPVDLLLVLDRSGSMANDMTTDTACSSGGSSSRRDAGSCAPKWPAMTTSLNQVLASSPAGVQWGLKFFTSPGGSSCTVNAGADVAVGQNTATRIQTAIAGTSPANNTPTKDAINAAVAYFKTVNDGLPHYILLATDGQPNCESGSGTSSALAVTNTVAAIKAAFDAGIKTYVIGIGPQAGNLDNFAQAGGTGTYFPATSPDALTAALTSIVKDVASCVFTMAAVPPDPTNLGVYLDKTTKVPLDPSDGYSLSADSLTVTLNGSYCAGLKDGTYQVVQVYFGCPGEPPPPIIP